MSFSSNSRRLQAILALLGLGACHQGVHSDPELCASLRLETPSACPEPYQAIDANQAAAICNDGNEVTSTLVSTCSSSTTVTGTWIPGKVAAANLSANFSCPGSSENGANEWSCKVASATVQFVDGTSLVFTGTGKAGYFAVGSCSPASFFGSWAGPEGWRANFSLTLPDFDRGSFPIATAGATNPSAKAVSLGLTLVPPDAVGFGLNTFSGGDVTVLDASLDPNFAISFSIDANLAVPVGDVPQEYAIFCGNANEFHSGV